MATFVVNAQCHIKYRGLYYGPGAVLPSELDRETRDSLFEQDLIAEIHAADPEFAGTSLPKHTLLKQETSHLKKRNARRRGAPPQSVWAVDPDALKGKSLDELNVMIAERDPNAGTEQELDPFEDAAEARAFLSRDYVAP